MTTVVQAKEEDLEKIVQLDRGVIGNESRREGILRAIGLGNCLIVKEGDGIAGFLLYDTHFFECTFISLIIVSPAKRRLGYASSLLEYVMNISPTRKVFSSTNQSNVGMQQVFTSNGFIRSGIVENLDEGDPEIIFYTSK